MNSEDDAQWQYKHDGQTAVADKPSPSGGQNSAQGSRPPTKGTGSITWTASEYIDHDRGRSWYLLLALATIAITVVIYFFTKDIFATVIIPIMGIIIGVFAVRKPRQLAYELNNSGIQVGEKFYDYRSFKSFSVSKEDSLNSLSLLPLKRFMPLLSIYYGAQDEEKIMDIIGEHLPYEEHKLDNIERFSRRLRF